VTRILCAICTGPAGAASTRIPCPLFSFEDKVHASLGTLESRENAESYLYRDCFHPPSSLRTQGPIRRGGDCFSKMVGGLFQQLATVVMGSLRSQDDSFRLQPQLRSACRPLKVSAWDP
jgi:hypothetical protein